MLPHGAEQTPQEITDPRCAIVPGLRVDSPHRVLHTLPLPLQDLLPSIWVAHPPYAAAINHLQLHAAVGAMPIQECLAESHAEAPSVHPRGEARHRVHPFLPHLRRPLGGCAQHALIVRALELPGSSEGARATQVPQHQLAGLAAALHQDVLGLNVTMGDAFLVKMVESDEELLGDRGDARTLLRSIHPVQILKEVELRELHGDDSARHPHLPGHQGPEESREAGNAPEQAEEVRLPRNHPEPRRYIEPRIVHLLQSH
mmetsp:Transcript_14966/g.43175  ORF Transcript_14966/g.43175 Transcript_14966/m.43175 type:complete len:258 (-) Transcript_14966:439-1212(-)